MSHVATETHEVRGTLLWDQHGDAPYWAVRSMVAKLGGGITIEAEVDGEPLQLTLSYSESGISPRPSDDVERLHEYGVYWTTEDGRRFGGELKPRFEARRFRKFDPDASFWDREKIAVPENLGQAVAFQVTAGIYRTPDHYPRMLPKVLLELAREAGVGWNPDYFAGAPHEFSTITALEQTVRLTREESKKLTDADGIMGRLFFLLSDLKGSKAEYSADNTEVVGYIHQLRLDPDAAGELAPGRRRGFQFKSYHPKHVRGSADDPLYHPRVGTLFKKKWNDHRGVPWHEWCDLARELEENLINILQWANVPVAPGPTFVDDDYFEVRESSRRVGFYNDPTPAIEREQDSVVMRVLARANDSSWDLAEQLAADGGEKHYARLDLPSSTAYRALDELEGVAESQNGVFRFISEKVRQEVKSVVDYQRRVQQDLERSVIAVAHLLDIDPQKIQQKGSAFQRWITEYTIDVDERRDGRPRLKIAAALDRLRSTSVPLLDDVLRDGLAAWRDAGLDPQEFHDAEVIYQEPDGSTRTAIVRAALR